MPPAVNVRPGEVQEVPLSMDYTLIKIHGTTNEKQVSKGLTAFASCVIYFYSGVFYGPVWWEIPRKLPMFMSYKRFVVLLLLKDCYKMAPKVKMEPENDAIPNVESARGSDNFRILFRSVYHLESVVNLQTDVNTTNHFKIRVKIPPKVNPTSYTYRKWVKPKLHPGKLRWNLKLTQLKGTSSEANLHYWLPCWFSTV